MESVFVYLTLGTFILVFRQSDVQNVCEGVAFEKMSIHVCFDVEKCFVVQFGTSATLLQTLCCMLAFIFVLHLISFLAVYTPCFLPSLLH